MRILSVDQLIDLALVATTERSGFPAANVQHPHLTRVWRSANSVTQRLTFNAGTGLTIAPTVAALLAHNLTAAATASVEQNSVDDWAAPPVSVAFDVTDPLALAYMPGSAYQYLSFIFDDVANPDGYIEIGRAMAGIYWQSIEELERGTDDEVEDTTVVSESETGQGFADLGVKKQKYTMSFGIMQPETRVSLKAIYAAVGQYMPIVLVKDENALDIFPPLYCTMRKALTFTGAGGGLWRDSGLEFTEAL